jgi:hypothetical protein
LTGKSGVKPEKQMKMKHIPQFEMPLPSEPFRLVSEETQDGNRVEADKAKSEKDKAQSESLQTDLFK